MHTRSHEAVVSLVVYLSVRLRQYMTIALRGTRNTDLSPGCINASTQCNRVTDDLEPCMSGKYASEVLGLKVLFTHIGAGA